MAEEKAKYNTFAKTNVELYVDEYLLCAVNTLDVQDYPQEKLTRIVLQLTVFNNQYVVEHMRRSKFSFKIINRSNEQGWLGLDCALEKYHMQLSALETSSGILEQTLVIATNSFVYQDNLRPQISSGKEEEDYANLIAILKASQEKSAKAKNVAVLPDTPTPEKQSTEQAKSTRIGDSVDWGEVAVKDEELIFLNAKDPTQLTDMKPRKLKKNKK